MLTISKPLSAGQAQCYHQKEFTAKEQNYWSQCGVTAGEWQGRLAQQFGLAETVSAEHFAKLSQGQHPQTGKQLVRQRASYEYQDADGKRVKTMEQRAGWDATFSAPKSVSLTALVGGDERVREAHRESVRVALDQLEHYTSVHPDLLNSRFAYVSISRASLDAKIYTNDAADLGQKLSGEVSKTSAIEFSPSTANAMTDLSLGQGI
jgi:hypothetical protein